MLASPFILHHLHRARSPSATDRSASYNSQAHGLEHRASGGRGLRTPPAHGEGGTEAGEEPSSGRRQPARLGQREQPRCRDRPPGAASRRPLSLPSPPAPCGHPLISRSAAPGAGPRPEKARRTRAPLRAASVRGRNSPPHNRGPHRRLLPLRHGDPSAVTEPEIQPGLSLARRGGARGLTTEAAMRRQQARRAPPGARRAAEVRCDQRPPLPATLHQSASGLPLAACRAAGSRLGPFLPASAVTAV